MGSIRKRNDKFQAQVRREGVSPVSKTFSKKKDAIVWVRGLEARIDAGETHVVAPKAITLGDLLKRYSEEITPLKKGRDPELRRLKRLLRDNISSTPLAKLNGPRLVTFRDRRIGDGIRAAQYDLVLIRHCLNIARKEWGVSLPSNPVNDIRVPNGIRHRERRLEEGEYEKLKVAAESCRNLLLWPVIEFALATAMRRSEILSLEWSNIDLGTGIATLPNTKNGKHRRVPLSPSALETLKQLPHKADQAFKTTDYAIRQGWDRLVRRAGIENLKFHDLRHEAISLLFEHGLNLPEVSLISGHRDPRMLFRYTHLRADNIKGKLG
jgi:integrase